MYSTKRRPSRVGASPVFEAPVDNYGIPLPIIDDYRYVDRCVDRGHSPNHLNDHHAFFESCRPELKSTLGGLALPMSRLQRTREVAHNRYHEIYFEPSLDFLANDQPLSTVDERCLKLIVLSMLGYMPKEGLLVFDDDPTKRISTDRLRMNQSLGYFCLERPKQRRGDPLELRNPLGEFTLRFIMQYMDEDVYERVFNPKISRKTGKQRRTARAIMVEAVKQAASVPKPLVAAAVKDGRIERSPYGNDHLERTAEAIWGILDFAYPIDIGKEVLDRIHQQGRVQSGLL